LLHGGERRRPDLVREAAESIKATNLSWCDLTATSDGNASNNCEKLDICAAYGDLRLVFLIRLGLESW